MNEPLAVERAQERAPEATTGFPLISEEEIKQAELAVERVKRIKRIALSVTSPGDWVELGGRPYLQESGTMKVAQLFGVSFSAPVVKREVENVQGHEVYRYIAELEATWKGRSLGVEGVASTDDLFFSRRGGKEIPLSERDFNSIRKKAVTNAQNRALKKILGLGGLTWEDVRGGKREGVATVDYGASKRKKQDRTGEDGAEIRTQLANMILDLAEGDKDQARDLLQKLSSFEKDGQTVEGKRHVHELTDGRVRVTYGKVKPKWEAYTASLKEMEKATEEEVASD